MAAATVTTVANHVPSGVAVPKFSDGQIREVAVKLTKLRDDIVSGTHPRLKVPPEHVNKGKHPVRKPGVQKTPQISDNASTTHHALPPKPTDQFQPPVAPPILQPNHAAPSGGTLPNARPTIKPPQLDPIFLTKADILVSAEIQQKRLRLERALDEEAQQKRTLNRHRTFEQDALPNFDVAAVFREAQDRVKPVPFRHGKGANGDAVSTGSLDENTFYSSQVYESTTTSEDLEEQRRPRNIQQCRFFMNGKICPYGDNCIFPHGAAAKEKVKGSTDAPQVIGNGDRSVEGRSVQRPEPGLSKTDEHLPNTDVSGPSRPADHNQSVKESLADFTSQQKRIAELEAELQAIKAAKQVTLVNHQSTGLNDRLGSQDGSAYSPPGPDEFGRDVSLRDPNVPQMHEMQLTQSTNGQGEKHSQRDDARRVMSGHSPSTSRNVRVIRNHITSPFAPQPARVSPLAVAKVSQVTQTSNNQRGTQQASNMRHIENTSVVESPNGSLQQVNLRKRRRDLESNDNNRNVMARREVSPVTRVKQEPSSPAPFENIKVHRPSAIMHEATPYVVDSGPEEYQPRSHQRVVYQPRARTQVIDEQPRLSHSVRALAPQDRQSLYISDEPDLRRVVSERQLRGPSLGPRYQDFPEYETRSQRAPSQEIQMINERRASVRPQARTYTPSRAPRASILREMQRSPAPPHAVVMPPPSRRVFVDQYGNRVPDPQNHQPLSLAGYPDDSRPYYAPQVPRSASVRHHTYINQDQTSVPEYDRRPPTAGPRQYRNPSVRSQQVYPDEMIVDDSQYDPRQPLTQVVHREPARYQALYDEPTTYRRDGTVRLQSVRPADDRYEVVHAREDFPRMSSVRPPSQHTRIIQVSEPRREIPPAPQFAAQPQPQPRAMISAGYPTDLYFGNDDRSGIADDGVYRFSSAVPERRYVSDIEDDPSFYEGGRNVMQRM